MNASLRFPARFAQRIAGALAGVISLASPLVAETVSGRVRDANSNSFLFGARVSVQGSLRSTTTDREGRYVLRDLEPGSYTVEVNYLGYEPVSHSVIVPAGSDVTQDFTAGSEVVAMESFVVEGIREGQARALQQKMAAVNVIDVVSADSVGKLPDGNAAEAVRRVPGVSAQIDQDEGRYVVVRGIDASLNNVTLNGLGVGTPSEQGNRGIALDSVPADLISRLEVIKAVTPDMDANAIGGTVNIVTQSAFDRPEGFFYATVGGFHDSFSDRTTPNGSLTFGRVVGDGRWGVVAGFSYSLKDFKSQTVNTRSWAQVNDHWMPLTQQSYDYDIERERVGANVALQFRPSEGHELALRLNRNEFSDAEDRQSVQYEYRLGTLSEQTATSGNNSGGRANRQFRDYEQTGTIDAAALEGRHELTGDATLTWQAGVSRGERDVSKRNDWEFRSGSSAFPNTYDLSGEVLVITPTTGAYYDPASFPFRRVRFRSDLEQEDVASVQADLQRAFTFRERDASWKIGAKAVSRDKEDDRTNRNYLPASGAGFTLGEAGLAGPEVENYFDGLFRFGSTLNMPAIESFFAANPERFVLDELASLQDSTADDFEASEDVFAGYAMVELPIAARWTLLAGVRLEHTSADYAANELLFDDGDFTGDIRRVSGGRDCTHVLPGLHLVWRPRTNVALRIAWTNTIGRPNYAHLAPRRELDAIESEPGSGVYLGSLSSGNPELDPYESMNFDVSAEYYLPNAGILSAGFFHKEIDNPIYELETFETDVTIDGRRYSQLSTSAPANADEGRITGVELAYQQPFTFLPAPFDGFGISANMTFVDSSVRLFTRNDKLPFVAQADTLANVALYYEKHGWEVRIAYSHTDDYLDGVGADPERDIYIRGREVIDAKISYRISPRFRVFAEFLNLDSEPLREFTGVPARENDFELYEWKARFGVSFNL